MRRVGAALLLLAFAIGSIVARDAALTCRTRELREASGGVDLVVATASIGVRHRRTELKLRPSGISKRSAWSPTDPPDDDDEFDDDSDTFAARHARALPIDVGVAVVAACSAGAPRFARPLDDLRSKLSTDQPRVRGPPSLRVAAS